MDWAVVAFLVGLIAGCYAYIRAVDYRSADKRETLEDCVEQKLDTVQKSLDGFEKKVIDRLARIETSLNHVKKGVGDSHSECPRLNNRIGGDHDSVR